MNDRVARGEVQPDVRDALRAAELLARYEPIEEVDEHACFVAFVEYHEAAQAVMTQEQFIEFGRRLSQNPILEDLARQADQRSAG